MFNKITNYFKNEDYSLCIKENKIYIDNYESLIDIDESNLSVLVKGKKIKIYGKNLIINKLVEKELLISGIIERVDLFDR